MAHFSNFLLLLVTTIFITFTAESTELWCHDCGDGIKVLINSNKVSPNIGALLPKLVSGTVKTGYTTASSGGSKGQVIYGLAQCRGDVSCDDCADCIQTAAKQIRKLCPNQSDDVKVWYDYCFLRYSTRKFAGNSNTSYAYIIESFLSVSDPDSFNKKLGYLTKKVISEAVKPVNKGLGRGKIKLSESEKIYELAQCTRDLSPLSCSQCLAKAVGIVDSDCKDLRGCTVLYSSCILRYELHPFYFPLDATETLRHAPQKNYDFRRI